MILFVHSYLDLLRALNHPADSNLFKFCTSVHHQASGLMLKSRARQFLLVMLWKYRQRHWTTSFMQQPRRRAKNIFFEFMTTYINFRQCEKGWTLRRKHDPNMQILLISETPKQIGTPVKEIVTYQRGNAETCFIQSLYNPTDDCKKQCEIFYIVLQRKGCFPD